MSSPHALGLSRPSPRSADPIEAAARRLKGILPKRADSTVLVDFLEDDLREGLAALADVETHFAEALEAIGADRPSPISLLEAGEDGRVLQRLEYLVVVVSQLRRRLSMAAGKLRYR